MLNLSQHFCKSVFQVLGCSSVGKPTHILHHKGQVNSQQRKGEKEGMKGGWGEKRYFWERNLSPPGAGVWLSRRALAWSLARGPGFTAPREGRVWGW